MMKLQSLIYSPELQMGPARVWNSDCIE